MTTESKTLIKNLLDKYCDGFTSQAKAANSLKGVSAGTISQIRNGNWELISEAMWLSVGKQVGLRPDEWVIVNTRNHQVIQKLLLDAKENSRVHAIVGHASWGKDTGLMAFKSSNKNFFQVNCSEELKVKYLLAEILESMGEVASGTAYKMSKMLVAVVSKFDTPVIALNEYEKLDQRTFKYFITLFNLLEGKCGIIVSGTPALKNRILNGVNLCKPGYDEIYSRVGKRFIELTTPTKMDIANMCTANGVTEPLDMSEIYNSANGDLRRVKKLIQNKASKASKANEGEQAA